MKKGKIIADRFSLAADLAGESGPRQPLVEIFDTCRLIVENHRGIISYDSLEIGVKVTYGCVHVRGQKLQIMKMTDEQLVITGVIESVMLESRCK